MMSSPFPKFKVGDKVISFRGERATVRVVYQVDTPGKSHRVGVTWENEDEGMYYEQVFEFDTPKEIQEEPLL